MRHFLFFVGIGGLIYLGYNNLYTKLTIDLKCIDNKVQIYAYKENVSDRSLDIKKPENLIGSEIFKDDNGNFMKCSN